MVRAQVEAERRAATVARLAALRVTGSLTTEHVRLAAQGDGVSERTVWRWLDDAAPRVAPRRTGPEPYALSATDREAIADYRGNIAAVGRARAAVVAGDGSGFLTASRSSTWLRPRPVSRARLRGCGPVGQAQPEREVGVCGEPVVADIWPCRADPDRKVALDEVPTVPAVLVLGQPVGVGVRGGRRPG
ncbi:hypothetical protein GCM10007977_110010 [Dactylosporangium sucinum]|uniref:Uncharacterized protein n=1 Tax=Dactylosporangium sucinum TaxID=1424081 RepID=A0A917UHV4_9ACTN|nr:hypothetical protein GCM10007977_110010 [Dactylosporangium sucinum]